MSTGFDWCHHVNVHIDVDDISEEKLLSLEKLPEAGVVGKNEDTYTVVCGSHGTYGTILDWLDENHVRYTTEVI